jgi:hypothetical protein
VPKTQEQFSAKGDSEHRESEMPLPLIVASKQKQRRPTVASAKKVLIHSKPFWIDAGQSQSARGL